MSEHDQHRRISNGFCSGCNKPIYIRPRLRDRQEHFYCSQDCYEEHRYRKRIRSCEVCGNKITGRGKTSTSRYCSRACSNKGRAGTRYTGENAKNNVVSQRRVRQTLIEIYGEVCVICGLGNEWNKKALTLHIDHIDGNRNNNELNNLRLLCPNCHSQTETYGVKKMRKMAAGG